MEAMTRSQAKEKRYRRWKVIIIRIKHDFKNITDRKLMSSSTKNMFIEPKFFLFNPFYRDQYFPNWELLALK